MWGRSTPIVEASLRRLHPDCVEDPERIQALLQRALEGAVIFHRGLNARVDLETAELREVQGDRLVLNALNFDPHTTDGQIFLNFSVDGRPYFFAGARLAPFVNGRLVVSKPNTVFFGERRDRGRQPPGSGTQRGWRVRLVDQSGSTRFGRVQNVSPSGMGLIVQGQPFEEPFPPITVRFLEGPEAGSERRLDLRHQGPAEDQRGWLRIGLSGADDPGQGLISIEEGGHIFKGAEPESVMEAQSAEARASEVLRIRDSQNEEIVGLVDAWGEHRGATGIVLPNGWGQTKEALLPLARTLLATFRSAGQPVVVIRYDGIRRRGQSHNDPECFLPGRSDEHFVFSQAVTDLQTVVHRLRDPSSFGVSRLVVVSFSAAAIEVRKALARERTGSIDGWVSVVGSPDIQSMTRAISGGVDFAAGFERGLSFGKQELLGVRVDIDRISADAAQHEMVFLEDSRRDMTEIDVPVTWFHGRYDAWVDLTRVRDILSHGDTSRRRLVLLPTGHQLRSSRNARRTFAAIAQEVARMALARDVRPVLPRVSEVRRLRSIERSRLPKTKTDLRAFWCDYLVGRDRSLGIELLTSSSAYRALMHRQLEMLGLGPGNRVADLGSGTGSFALALCDRVEQIPGIRITAIDYVREAMLRARRRLRSREGSLRLAVDQAEVNLDPAGGGGMIPLASASQDRVLASLLLSYLDPPGAVLAEVYRILRPGGRLVLSSLCPDADISRLYFEAYAEIRAGGFVDDIPELQRYDLDRIARSFLNDAAKIIEFEEADAFRFWDPEELAERVSAAGFHVLETRKSLGTPPQAMILSARRPESG